MPDGVEPITGIILLLFLYAPEKAQNHLNISELQLQEMEIDRQIDT